MSIFQIFSVLFALFMMYVVRIHKRRAALTIVETSFWYSMWILFIVLALFPNLMLGFAGVLNFNRVFDLLVVGAFMILTMLVISNYLSQKELRKRIERLTREKSITNRLAQKVNKKGDAK